MSMTTSMTTSTPDLAAVKAKQQQTWSSGDFHVIAALIQPTAERLVDSADLHAGMRVLDVATGSGNAAIAAARLGATVEGVDYVPAPAGVASPILWGTESHLRGIFGGGISSLSVTERTFTWRFTSAQALVDTFRTWYGPTFKAFAALGETDAQAALEADLVALATTYDRLGDADAIAVPATYLEAVAVRA